MAIIPSPPVEWTPYLPEGGAPRLYQYLAGYDGTEDDQKWAWNQYTAYLANTFLPYLSARDREAIQTRLAPVVGYNVPIPGAYGADTEAGARAGLASSRWDAVREGMNYANTRLFGAGDQTPGAVDPIEKTGEWLRGVMDAGQRLGVKREGDYYSRARQKRHADTWTEMEKTAADWGIAPDVVTLGKRMYAPTFDVNAPSPVAASLDNYTRKPPTGSFGGRYAYRNPRYT